MTGRAEQGFTLVEVLVAMAVLAIGLTAAFKLQAMDLDLVRAERQTTRACLAAESLLWEWTVEGFSPTGSAENQATGRIDLFRFQAVLGPAPKHPGLDTITLNLDDGPGGEPAREFRRLSSPGQAP